MNIIFVTKKGAGSRSFTVGHGGVWLGGLGAFLLLLCGSVLYIGYEYGVARESVRGERAALNQEVTLIAPVEVENGERERLRAELRAQKQEIDEARRWIDDNLGVVAGRIGNLQARVMRIEALGQRLAANSGMDDGEFDFASDPPTGGVEVPAAGPQWDLRELQRDIDALLERLDDREQQLSVMELLLEGKTAEAEVSPAGRPVDGGWISSGFGRRTDPITGKRSMHHGLDFGGRVGSPIKSVAAGVVTQASRSGSYGLLVEIDHGNGYTTRYAHNKKLLVSVGDVVRRGDLIAQLGSTGRSTGAHLHFEVRRDGRPLNPRKYVDKQPE